MIDFAASVSGLLMTLGSWYVWLIENYVLVSPLAVLSLVCGVVNYRVNLKLWKIDSIEHEWNPIHRWFMARFGVDGGMMLSTIIFSILAFSGIAISLSPFYHLIVTPQIFLQGFVMFSVPPLAIASPLAVVVLANDYRGLRGLERDTVTFKVVSGKI